MTTGRINQVTALEAGRRSTACAHRWLPPTELGSRPGSARVSLPQAERSSRPEFGDLGSGQSSLNLGGDSEGGEAVGRSLPNTPTEGVDEATSRPPSPESTKRTWLGAKGPPIGFTRPGQIRVGRATPNYPQV
jgi:hypothetical protein